MYVVEMLLKNVHVKPWNKISCDRFALKNNKILFDYNYSGVPARMVMVLQYVL